MSSGCRKPDALNFPTHRPRKRSSFANGTTTSSGSSTPNSATRNFPPTGSSRLPADTTKTSWRRLATLSQPPHSYLVRNKTKKDFFRHSTYTRSSKLDAMLEQKPEYLGGSRAHLLYSSLIVASTELGINADPHAKLLRFIDLHTIGWTANKERRRVPYTDDILKIPSRKILFST